MKLYPIVFAFIFHEVCSAKISQGILYSTHCTPNSRVRGEYTCKIENKDGLKPNFCSVISCYTCELSDVKNVKDAPNTVEYVIKLTPIKLPACDPTVIVKSIDTDKKINSSFDRLHFNDPYFITDLPSVTGGTQDASLSTDIEKVFKFNVNSYNADDLITIQCDENLETKIESKVLDNRGKILTKRSVTVKMKEKLLNSKQEYSFKLAIPGRYNEQEHKSNFIRYTPTYNPTLTCESTSTYNRKFKCKLVSLYDFVEMKITHEMRNFKFSINNSEKKKENSVFKEEFEIDVECPPRLLDVETFSFTVVVMQTSDHKMFEETFTESHILLPAEHEPYVNCVQRQTSTEQCNYNFYNCQVVCTSHILKLQSESENYVLVTKKTKGIQHKDLYDHSFSLMINFIPGANTNSQTFKLIFNSESGQKITDCDLPHTFTCNKAISDIHNSPVVKPIVTPNEVIKEVPTRNYNRPRVTPRSFPEELETDIPTQRQNSPRIPQHPYSEGVLKDIPKSNPNFQQVPQKSFDEQMTKDNGKLIENNNNKNTKVKDADKKTDQKAKGENDSKEHSRSVSNSPRFGLPVVIISILGGIGIGMYLMRKRKHWRFSSRNFGNVENSMINLDLYDKTLN